MKKKMLKKFHKGVQKYKGRGGSRPLGKKQIETDFFSQNGFPKGCSSNTFVINRPGVAGAVLQTRL